MKPYFQIILALLFSYSFYLLAQESDVEDVPFDHAAQFVDYVSKSSQHEKEQYFDHNPLQLTLSAECEPLTTVAGCVNVFSGHFFQIERDLKGNTIEPLDFIRYYDSGSTSESFLGFGFGSGFPLWASDILKGERHHYALISEREGFLLPYRDKEMGPSKICSIDPRLLKKGYTNLSRAVISGHANFVNWKAAFRTNSHVPEGEWIVQLGDGSKRIYGKCVQIDKGQQARMNFPTKTAYLLTREIKPNGNQLLFSYERVHGKPRLTHVKTVNRTGKSTLNELTLHYSRKNRILSNPYGDHVEYTQVEDIRPLFSMLGIRDAERKFLVKVASSQQGISHYEMTDFTWKIKKIHKERNRWIQVAYDSSGRVKALYEPRENQEAIKRFEFRYHQDSTDVIDALGQLTTYHFDDHERLSHIDYWSDQALVRQDVFEWSQRTGEEGWLHSKSIRLGKNIYHLKSFAYDKRGNIIRETLYGNLTGEKQATFTLAQKSEMDQAIIHYTYTHDARNLLKEKLTPEGLNFSYDYLPGTHLCTKAICKYEGKIQERAFRTYDDNGQIEMLIEDDGSSEQESDLTDVTFRKIKKIEAVKEKGAAFGKPQRICEYYGQTKHPILLRETFLTYDEKGCEKERKAFNSQGKLCIHLSKKFDDRLRLIEETNTLGHTTRYLYDDSNNKIEEELIGSGKKIHLTYDLGNRLTQKTEIHDNGQVFTTTYKYNSLDQLICETDSYGHSTFYKYDRLGNQIESIQPIHQNVDGKTCFPTLHKKYNLLNQLIAKKDENGHETHYTYNAYGSPTKITHPDGAEEQFLYTPCGWLKEKRHPDGTSIAYDYDAKGHLIKETFFDQEKKPIKQEEYHYKGALLQSKIDSIGLITTYEYDGAGRKIAEKIGNLKIITYTYDDFDHLIKKEQHGRQDIFEYDSLDRLISKTLQEGHEIYAKETYEYNIHGDQTKTTIWQTPDKQSIYQTHYHSDHTRDWQEDPKQSRTSWKYDHHHFNGLGFVQARTIIDPLGRSTREADDAHQRLARQDHYFGEKQQSSTHYTYDPIGHLVKQHSLIMADGEPLREYFLLRRYNSRGLLASEKEMPHGKTTRYHYDSMTRLKVKEKPDGVKLSYTYGPLGKLRNLHSSDSTIHYTYTHDLHGNLTQVKDHVHHFTQTRRFDPYDRLESEEISPGITLHYTYDPLDRITSMTLSGHLTLQYLYDAYHLRKIQRLDANGHLLYEIDCSYDLQGNLTDIHTPAGNITYTYDSRAKATAIQSPFWEEHIEEYDAACNVIKIRQKDSTGILQGHFAYDRWNRLCFESPFDHTYTYDSIGNCLKKNNISYKHNALNQLTSDGQAEYIYDTNGNLTKQSSTTYTYDALHRLSIAEEEGHQTTFIYDALGRCLSITDDSGTKQLLYQGEQEIGSLVNGQLQEFRLIHPDPRYDYTFAIELQGQTFFPIQDSRANICALQKQDGSLVEWTRYSAFGEKLIFGDLQGIYNPWRFANKREVINLTLFAHRFYNPQLMRWQTTDPLGFEDGLNLYTYVHNNPFCYKDPDGQFAFVIPLIVGAFGTGGIVFSGTTIGAIAGTTIGLALGWGVYKACKWVDSTYNQVETDEEKNEIKTEKKGRKRGNDNEIKGGPPREKNTGNYLPDPMAEGASHTTLGVREGKRVGSYIQGATFDEKGEFKGRTDVTDHGRHDHSNPHYHPATGPNSADSPPMTIPEFFW